MLGECVRLLAMSPQTDGHLATGGRIRRLWCWHGCHGGWELIGIMLQAGTGRNTGGLLRTWGIVGGWVVLLHWCCQDHVISGRGCGGGKLCGCGNFMDGSGIGVVCGIFLVIVFLLHRNFGSIHRDVASIIYKKAALWCPL